MAVLTTLSQPATVIHAATSFTVNSIADSTDGACTTDPGGCTLREAIEAANANLNPSEQDIIAFNIPGDGVQIIRVGSGNRPGQSLPSITEPVLIDGTTQPGASCSPRTLLIELHGAYATGESVGVHFTGTSSTARALAVHSFRTNALLTGDGNHRVECSNIGTPATQQGDDSALGSVGVFAQSLSNTIGGTSPSARNVILSATGVQVDGHGTAVINNTFVVPDPSAQPLPRTHLTAVSLLRASYTRISFNQVNGWDVGIRVDSAPGSLTIDNWIEDNTIGLIPPDNPAVGANGTGVLIERASYTLIQRNQIQNSVTGITIIDAEGLSRIWSNTIAHNSDTGVAVSGIGSTFIGDNVPERRNEIVGNRIGIHLDHGTARILGNYIGTVANGLTHGNEIGILVEHQDLRYSTVIGEPGGSNTISGNERAGIEMYDAWNVQISSNRIGLETSGLTSRPNGLGIRVAAHESPGADRNISIASNIISTNKDGGIALDDVSGVDVVDNWLNYIPIGPGVQPSVAPGEFAMRASGSDISIRSNLVYSDEGPGILFPESGVRRADVVDNSIFGYGSGIYVVRAYDVHITSNEIFANHGSAVIVLNDSEVAIRGNKHSTNEGLPIDLGGDGPTLNDPGDLDSGPNQQLNFPVLHWARSTDGELRVDGLVSTTPGTTVSLDFYYRSVCLQGYNSYSIMHVGSLESLVVPPSGVAQFDTFVPAESIPIQGSLVATASAHLYGGGPAITSEVSDCIGITPLEGTVSKLSPSSVVEGSASFTLLVQGERLAGGTIYWGEEPLSTTERELAGKVDLEGIVPRDLVETTGQANVSVRYGDGGFSNESPFLISLVSTSDANCDGEVDPSDALRQLRVLAWLDPYDVGSCYNWDADSDGELSLADVLYIRKVAAGLLPR